MPAGISIESHFTTGFYIFPNMGFITFNEEFQFARRLRIRDGLWPTVYGYIEKGKFTNLQVHGVYS